MESETFALTPTPIELIAAVLFATAILHTFSTKLFGRIARLRPAHAGIWHLLGEVEVVFGFWAMVLVVVMAALDGAEAMTAYVDSRNFTEPLFVFVIMVIAATRPVVRTAMGAIAQFARAIPLPGSLGFYFLVLALVPLLGSLITEPAAMTMAALILADRIFAAGVSTRLKYATLGVLFVNVSIGGTLTHFAAPPVLMVANTWNWGTAFMLSTFGWKAAIAVVLNACAVTVLFRRELAQLPPSFGREPGDPAPPLLVLVHVLFLVAVVVFAHHPALFMGLFMFFLGIAHAYRQHQDRLMLREGMLVAFFLAGLVVLGGLQRWWLEPLLLGMSDDTVFIGATILTAFTDNAALTYLGSQVQGLTESFKYALVAGAVTGGGLTIIANAPNPAGIAILRGQFEDGAVNPLWLALAALGPTLVAALAFRML